MSRHRLPGVGLVVAAVFGLSACGTANTGEEPGTSDGSSSGDGSRGTSSAGATAGTTTSRGTGSTSGAASSGSTGGMTGTTSSKSSSSRSATTSDSTSTSTSSRSSTATSTSSTSSRTSSTTTATSTSTTATTTSSTSTSTTTATGPVGGCSGKGISALEGWASQGGGTTGGQGGSTVTATSLSALNSAVSGSGKAIVMVSGTITGTVNVGSNKTIIGECGAQIHGSIQMNGSANVIVRDLTVVGNNCTDSPSDCSAGEDAITVNKQAHNLWFDHDDISNGSDGNLDVTQASDFVTISWTKFSYSGRRTDPAGASGGHQFSNLIGASDTDTGDQGHLRVTFHHVWWANNVFERMPRVRFGDIHVFNSLYTASGNSYCIGLGVSANVRDENNVFVNVKEPIDTADFANGSSIIQSIGNLYSGTSGSTADKGGTAFTPPYGYTLDATSGLQTAIQNGAGPQ
jgi:pectate lyase